MKAKILTDPKTTYQKRRQRVLRMFGYHRRAKDLLPDSQQCRETKAHLREKFCTDR